MSETKEQKVKRTVVIRVSDEDAAFIKDHGSKGRKKLGMYESAAALFDVARSRLGALSRYAGKKKPRKRKGSDAPAEA